MSTAMIVRAPFSTAPSTAASPTPPQPMTATESPRTTGAVLMAAPRPAITPQPSRPATSGRAAGLTFVHWPAATSVFSANAPIPSAGDRTVPSARVIFWMALWVLKQYQGRPRLQARHSPQTARQFRMTKSPGATSVTRRPPPRPPPRPRARAGRGSRPRCRLPGSAGRYGRRRTPGPGPGPRPGPGSGTRIVVTSTFAPLAGATTPRTSCVIRPSCRMRGRSGRPGPADPVLRHTSADRCFGPPGRPSWDGERRHMPDP